MGDEEEGENAGGGIWTDDLNSAPARCSPLLSPSLSVSVFTNTYRRTPQSVADELLEVVEQVSESEHAALMPTGHCCSHERECSPAATRSQPSCPPGFEDRTQQPCSRDLPVSRTLHPTYFIYPTSCNFFFYSSFLFASRRLMCKQFYLNRLLTFYLNFMLICTRSATPYAYPSHACSRKTLQTSKEGIEEYEHSEYFFPISSPSRVKVSFVHVES